jgi:meso-butanediol dehydrogenase/(S,S)-butanediol dehydrogenase/diacetyl reductase
MIDTTVRHFGRLDVMFNNAGVNKPMNFMDVTEENWSFIMDVNGLGCLIGMQEAARQMIAQAPPDGRSARSSTPPRSPAGRGSTTWRPTAPRNGRWSA